MAAKQLKLTKDYDSSKRVAEQVSFTTSFRGELLSSFIKKSFNNTYGKKSLIVFIIVWNSNTHVHMTEGRVAWPSGKSARNPDVAGSNPVLAASWWCPRSVVPRSTPRLCL